MTKTQLVKELETIRALIQSFNRPQEAINRLNNLIGDVDIKGLTKATAKAKAEWLLEHPKLWLGYSEENKEQFDNTIIGALQDAGLLSLNTRKKDCSVSSWVSLARKMRRDALFTK